MEFDLLYQKLVTSEDRETRARKLIDAVESYRIKYLLRTAPGRSTVDYWLSELLKVHDDQTLSESIRARAANCRGYLMNFRRQPPKGK